MPRYAFSWPRLNGDQPTTCVRQAETLREAVIAAMRDHGSALNGCSVFVDGSAKAVAKMEWRWPGPVVNFGEDRVRVRLAPAGSWQGAREALDYKHARYEDHHHEARK
jgi:hypothetical protein